MSNKDIMNNGYDNSLTVTGIVVASNVVVGNAIVNWASSNLNNEFNNFFYALNANNLIEGTSNLYFTQNRASSIFFI
jgi:hypothetical protein